MRSNVLMPFAISIAFLGAPIYGQVCGDGNLDPHEQCDDGNTDSGDGCNVWCRLECAVDSDCLGDHLCTTDQTYDYCYLPCTAHCGCPQGEYCYYGACVFDPKFPVYCCTKSGCPPGRWCFEPGGADGTCAESTDHHCDSACDCGPAHCCKFDSNVTHNICVKDTADPWDPGGTVIGDAGECEIGVDPTYCCEESSCHAGWYAYGSTREEFLCFDLSEGGPSQYCGGKDCFFTGDCDPGESCFDVKHAAGVGKLCDLERSHCISNAVAEVVYGAFPSELLPSCHEGCFPGENCEVGWHPGGEYAVERIVGVCGSCGNATCDTGWGESAVNCSEDCTCGDGVCDTTEVTGGTCPTDCGTCGDAFCDPFETPKICPSDCFVEVGDGSCSSGEVASNLLVDCGCPESALYVDYPAACGDGVCQKMGDIPEDCINCWLDCEADLDADGDGIPDGCDNCPSDPLKTEPGVCGCGFPDSDTDGDGVLDCEDGCVNDPNKIAPGACGCGIADVDTDFDGTPDCIDGCADDPSKTEPGQCGCGVEDTDNDGDTIADCVDGCPSDPLNDPDGDGICDSSDLCVGSTIPESVPRISLRRNRYAVLGTQVEGIYVFDTVAPQGGGPQKLFTLEHTMGCTCEQILNVSVGEKSNLHDYGCSASVIEEWVTSISAP